DAEEIINNAKLCLNILSKLKEFSSNEKDWIEENEEEDSKNILLNLLDVNELKALVDISLEDQECEDENEINRQISIMSNNVINNLKKERPLFKQKMEGI
uniref:Uncharacterized protein n=1 Tax=Meloidogyne javanica TaxID=6303 RepID=A0A915LV06_MELJA